MKIENYLPRMQRLIEKMFLKMVCFKFLKVIAYSKANYHQSFYHWFKLACFIYKKVEELRKDGFKRAIEGKHNVALEEIITIKGPELTVSRLDIELIFRLSIDLGFKLIKHEVKIDRNSSSNISKVIDYFRIKENIVRFIKITFI